MNESTEVLFSPNLPIAAYQVTLQQSPSASPLQTISHHAFLVVSQGEMTVHINNTAHLASAGDLFFMHGNSILSTTEATPNATYQVVTFDLRALVGNDEQALSYCDRLDDHSWRIDTYLGRSAFALRELFDRLYQVTKTGTRAGYELEARGLVLQMMGRLMQDGRCHATAGSDDHEIKAQRAVRRVLALIEENFAQELTLGDMAAAAELSPNYFCRYFKKIAGCSPVEYLINYRLDMAAHMLITTEDTVADISLACGFNDASHFIKFFRRKKQVTPRRYRQIHTKFTPQR